RINEHLSGTFLLQRLHCIHDGDVWMLHITGPVSVEGKNFDVPANQSVWENCATYIQQTIREVGGESRTTLRVFAPIPAALLAGVFRGFERFWHVQFYHFWPGQGYQIMIDQPRR
ncbi:MAG: hypothetical protein K8L97_17400, partial [Anaerolineae bacterium]|nr:hypothetical protein [Anaerolineae bacterium]